MAGREKETDAADRRACEPVRIWGDQKIAETA